MNAYAISTILGYPRRFWRKPSKNTNGASIGSWVPFYEASVFSQNQRKAYTLPTNGQWVSVLHGIGTSSYPADSELKEVRSK